jgi:predicted phage terminase large subunit-like protein
MDLRTIQAALEDPAVRPELVKRSLYAFGVNYLPGVFCVPPAPFHWEWAKAFNARKSVCVIGARDLGKTVWAVADVIRAIAFKEVGYILWVCQDQAKAQERLYDITVQLQANQNLKGDFGELYNGKQEAALDIKERKTMAEFITTNGVKVRALGLGTGVRGVNYIDKEGISRRPDLIVLDDIDTISSVNTVELIDAGYNRVKGEIMGAEGASARYVVLGNVIKGDGVSQRIYREMGRRNDWACFWQPAVEKGVIAWPARIFATDAEADEAKAKGHKSPISLQKKLEQQGPTAYAQNYELVPYEGGEAIFRREWMHWAIGSECVAGASSWDRVEIICDPANSTKTLSDAFAITCWGHRGVQRVMLWGEELKGPAKDDNNALAVIEGLYRRYRANVVKIESVGYMATLARLLRERGIAVTEVKRHKDKVTRAKEVQAEFQNGNVYFSPDCPASHATVEQLLAFPNVTHDDLADTVFDAVARPAFVPVFA